MGRPQVGLPQLVGEIGRYASKYDMVELRLEAGALPRAATLRQWRKAAGPSFTFSVVLPDEVASLVPGKALDEALARSIEVATTLEARCILLATPTSVRPTPTTRERLAALAARLPRPGVVLAWEPRGLWEVADIVSVARGAGLLPVLDGARDTLPSGPVAYTRLRALGAQAPSARSLDRLAEQLAGRRESWVVVEHRPSAQRVRAHLARTVSEVAQAHAPIIVRPAPGRLRAEDEEQ